MNQISKKEETINRRIQRFRLHLYPITNNNNESSALIEVEGCKGREKGKKAAISKHNKEAYEHFHNIDT
jgi:hypothetical protein